MALPHATPAVITGDFAFISGMLGAINGKVVEGGTIAELRQAFDNLEALFRKLESHGFKGLGSIVAATIYLADMHDYPEVNDAYMQRLPHLPISLEESPSTTGRPSRTCVQVVVPREGKFEITVVAYRGRTPVLYIA